MKTKQVKATCLAVLLGVLPASLLRASAWDDPDQAARRAEERAQREEERAQREKERAEREAEKVEEAEEAYESGTDSLDESDWEDAAQAFSEVIRLGGRRADGALYWKAYAESKRGRRSEALAAIAELQKAFPGSRWVGEARALELEIKQASGQAPKPETESDEELKLLALNGLMNSNPARAVPLLVSFIQGKNSPRLKDRALFVLSQHDSPEARDVLARVAKDATNPDLQLRAIKYLGVSGDSGSMRLLSEVYAASSDVSVKRAILRSYMAADDKERILHVARTEKSLDLRREAIRQVGALGAGSELLELYRGESSTELKEEILEAMGSSEATGALASVAKAEPDVRLRRAAIRGLGVIDSREASAALVSMYASERDPAGRRQILEALFTQENAKALVELARTEKDPALRRFVVELLSNMEDSKEATDYLLEILQK